MFTTVCDAVSTNCCLRAASASMCRLESKVSQANSPVTVAATKAVANATQATSPRCGCRRGGGPGRLIRTLPGFAASTLTPSTDGAVPLAGPAARGARRLPGFDASISLSPVVRLPFGRVVPPTLTASGTAEAVSSVITPALEPTSDQPNSPRAPVCQHPQRTRQFHRRGRRTCRSGRTSPWPARSPALRAGGAPRPPVLRQAAVGRRRRAAGAAPEVHPAQACRTAAQPDPAARSRATAAAGRCRSAAPAAGTARVAPAPDLAQHRAATAPPAAPDLDQPAAG